MLCSASCFAFAALGSLGQRAALLSAPGASSEAERQLVAEQWDFLCQLEMVGEEGAFVLGWDEVLTEEELSVTLKVSAARGREGGQVPNGILVWEGGEMWLPASAGLSAAGSPPLRNWPPPYATLLCKRAAYSPTGNGSRCRQRLKRPLRLFRTPRSGCSNPQATRDEGSKPTVLSPLGRLRNDAPARWWLPPRAPAAGPEAPGPASVGSLQVLCMSEEEFKEYKEQDGWEEDSEEEEEEENSALSHEALSRLHTPRKQLLHDSVLLTLQSYASDLKAEQDLLNNKAAYEELSRREQQALHVRYGQKRILHRLLELVR